MTLRAAKVPCVSGAFLEAEFEMRAGLQVIYLGSNPVEQGSGTREDPVMEGKPI